VPEIDQYGFTHKEVVAALVKKANLHTDKWQLLVNFGLAAANIGPERGQTMPTALVAVTKVGLIKAKPDSPEELTVDAAVVNPAPQPPSSKKAKGRR
jgi:hypothetical protein